MSQLIENLLKLATEEGYNPSPLPGVGVYKVSQSIRRIPLCYSQGIIIVAQGRKRVYLDQQVFEYNPQNYLVLTLPLPAECETIVEAGKPLLSLVINIDTRLLGQLVRIFEEHQPLNLENRLSDNKGIFVSHCSQDLSDTVNRLADCLSSPLHCAILGEGMLREILLHILQGPNAAPLFALASHNTHLSRVERTLKYLHQNYQQALDVSQLATMANMSSSTFHRNFRQITASSPIQYIKKIRLNKARDLLLDQGLKVKQVAAEVGYESPTQFSREFKRYFGVSPQAIS